MRLTPAFTSLHVSARESRATAIILGAVLSFVSAPALVAQSRFVAATTIGTIDSVCSATLKEQRPYLVYLPPSYRDTTATPQRYPVLYLLDGDAHFHSVSGLVQILGTGVNGTYAVPEMIVIAIPNTNRMRDLTPTRTTTGFEGKPMTGLAATGGGPDFLRFMQTELIPEVESRYRTMPYRVLVGHSLGGLMAISALYTMPAVFNAYVAIDPSLWWDNALLLKQAAAHVATARYAQKALYVAQANTLSADDSLPNSHYSAITQFDVVLKAKNQSGLRYGFRTYPEDDHGSVPMIAEYDALRFIFSGFKMDMQRALVSPPYVVEHYRRVSEQFGATFIPSEGALRLLGDIELTRLTAVDSVRAVEHRVQTTVLYPQSYRAWDALGVLALARRDTVQARTAFARSLTVNPTGAAAREQLRALSATGVKR
jgi:uncharacterized protein